MIYNMKINVVKVIEDRIMIIERKNVIRIMKMIVKKIEEKVIKTVIEKVREI